MHKWDQEMETSRCPDKVLELWPLYSEAQPRLSWHTDPWLRDIPPKDGQIKH
jgi:hypothetical protein